MESYENFNIHPVKLINQSTMIWHNTTTIIVYYLIFFKFSDLVQI